VITKLIFSYIIGVAAGFIMGAMYVYNYHEEQEEQRWSKR
jgi:uncharacterized membrane-anchored protein